MLTAFSGRRPSQNEAELNAFVELMRAHGVRNYLEIGSREGDTFHHVMSSLPMAKFGVAVDLPGGLWGKSTTSRDLQTAIADLTKKGYYATGILGDSKSSEIIERVAGLGPYDAILIDGDHTYAGVLADWSTYGAMAPIVAFHDIVGEGQRELVHNNPVQVPRLWAEIKASGLRTVEFVSPGSAMGIGVAIRD
jgi:hypothetical protein